MDKMFCFQCEQTANQTGCTNHGVCGKSSETANLQDYLLGRIIDFANCSDITEENTVLIIKSLFTTITNVNFDNESIKKLINETEEKLQCEKHFSVNEIWEDDEDIRSLKTLVILGLKGIAAYAYHARILGFKDEDTDRFFYEALSCVSKNLSIEQLLDLVLKTGEINLKCMQLLDRANTITFGDPSPVSVTTQIQPGPFIVVSGHDLKDMALLLEQSKDSGVNIYTHGEMLPCHAYPELKKYSHLKGNFGTAWQNQQEEFDNIPAPVLFTTNCIMPLNDSYKDRVFTTSIVHYPGAFYIDENKDFSPVIRKAVELSGYKTIKRNTGINGGSKLLTGFGRNVLMNSAEKIAEGLKDGSLKHIFLVGGCDGAKPGRNYYTEFVKQTPENTLVITLACGKYRFNDLDFGQINGLPRIIDAGQCNDAFAAIQLVLELAEKLNCSVNDLPLSFILSWYEQKAVAVLLTLLSLGIENIKLGPSLPAFISPIIFEILKDKFKIELISSPENDINL